MTDVCNALILPDGRTVSNVGELRALVTTVAEQRAQQLSAVEQLDNPDTYCLCTVDVEDILESVGQQLRRGVGAPINDYVAESAELPAFGQIEGAPDWQRFEYPFDEEPLQEVVVSELPYGERMQVTRYRLIEGRYVVAEMWSEHDTTEPF